MILIFFLLFWSVRSFIVIKRNQVNLIHYQIVGLVFFSNFFSLILRIIVNFWQNPKESNGLLVIESICIALINFNSLINIFFVRKQWLTTRKLLYRQAVFTPKKEFYRKQIKMHRLYFQALQGIISVFSIAAGICYYMINYKSYHDDNCD